MFTITYDETSGNILSVSYGSGVTSAHSEDLVGNPKIEAGVFPTPVSDYCVLNQELQKRPEVTLALGPVLDLTTVPTGSVIRVTNESGDFIEATPEDVSIELTDPGVYKILVVPPSPYKALEDEVIVK